VWHARCEKIVETGHHALMPSEHTPPVRAWRKREKQATGALHVIPQPALEVKKSAAPHKSAPKKTRHSAAEQHCG
jgi:hypothetical protein